MDSTRVASRTIDAAPESRTSSSRSAVATAAPARAASASSSSAGVLGRRVDGDRLRAGRPLDGEEQHRAVGAEEPDRRRHVDDEQQLSPARSQPETFRHVPGSGHIPTIDV
jgi:hypothetical protein